MEYVIAAAAFSAAFAAARIHLYILSGAVLIAVAAWLYYVYYKRSGVLFHPAALFSLAWVGGAGVSALKLSRLQADWVPVTWLCIFLAWLFFAAAFQFGTGLFGKQEKTREKAQEKAQETADETFASGESSADCCRRAGRLLTCMIAVTAVSAAAFLLEAFLLGYIPLFTKDTPHAYSYFHISGVHYFTVSCVLVPSLLVLYADSLKAHCDILGDAHGCLYGKWLFPRLICLGHGRELFLALLCTFLSFCIPLLCVSRFQLIFSVLLAVFTKGALSGKTALNRRQLISAGLLLLCLIPLYVGLSIARAHDVSYLNGIFEMKNPDMPIFFTQPYMYIANNYDNLNCLIRALPEGGHTFGLRMLFPLWAFTGLKFLVPSLVNFPLYVTKEELTTVTLFYDAYYDFGLIGVILFAMLLGGVSGLFFSRAKSARGPAFYLIYAQLCFYLLFSFFTTWFSNPATWFYFGVSMLIGLFLWRR
ncbi:MAG: O-antigen polymerase [Eubacteriales bacterium]|nr:O-antigen polymerase [Eubacteriales bacterium]